MKSSKQKKRYDADMARLAEALSGGEAAFLRTLTAGQGDAAARWELMRNGLTRPQRLCAEAFAGGESFEQIADRTGYLLDDIYIYIVSAMRAVAPEVSVEDAAPAPVAEAALEHVSEPEPIAEQVAEPVSISEPEPTKEPAPEPRMSRRAARQTLDAEDDMPAPASRKWRGVALATALTMALVLAWMALRAPKAPVEEPAEQLPVEMHEQQVDIPAEVSDPDSYGALPDTLPSTQTVALPSSGGRAELAAISKEADGQPTSKPQIGRREYNAYLTAAAMPLPEGSHGEVTMTFRVNPYGRPSQIKVTSTLSREANHEAIRLLTNGPEWTESQRTVEITIRFN